MSKIKHFGDYVAAIFKLRRTERMAKEAYRSLQNAEGSMRDIQDRFNGWDARERKLKKEVSQMVRGETLALAARNAELSRNFALLSSRLDQFLQVRKDRSAPPIDAVQEPENESGIGAIIDSFYHKLENKYRGAPTDIRNKLRVYLPDVESAVIRTGGKLVMDLGCGRGDWLGLLQDSDIPAVGIDTKPTKIEELRDKGLNVQLGDARSVLAQTEDESLACITAHHLIEHLPFEEVLWIIRESMRVLAPGGVLLVETPNIQNVMVGATSFYNDPSRLHPMTDPVLNALFETVGFHPIETRQLHPHEKLGEFMAKPGFDPELANLMFGAQDLAILGHKPLRES